MKRYFLLLTIFISINIWVASLFHFNGFYKAVKSSTDSEGYYQYLPYLFIKKDILHQAYSYNLDNGYKLNKYTCGVAILEAPFFLIAYTVDVLDGSLQTGMENLYGFLIVISTSFYVFTALYILFVLITEKLDSSVAFITVAAIYLGTNLYYYTVSEPGMSHAYSFFCFSAYYWFIDRYYKSFNKKHLAFAAIFLGLATLIRPTNILLALLFLFYDVYTFNDLKQRLQFHIRNYSNLIILALVGLMVFLPQMLYWHALTGKYMFYSYQDETFTNWKSPYILEVLAGHKSGWLLYSPVMLFGLVGLMLALKERLYSAPVVLMIFVPVLYLCASWWAYTFGCGFGYRSFCEYSVIFALPMGFAIKKGLFNSNKLTKITTMFVLIVFIYYSVKITRLYYLSGGCWDGPDWHWHNYFEKLGMVF